MLIPVERLFTRWRHVPSRADELIALRQRARVERTARATREEREAAHEVRALKLQLSSALAGVTSCASCAEGKPAPRGVFTGGDCCSGVTAELFSDDEVAALAQAGTRARDLTAPRGDHAGCAFRGAMGCTLQPVHRPVRCVTYVCGRLQRELRDRDALAAVDEMICALQTAMTRFRALRNTRIDDELLAPLEAALR
jgi:hypothetical protein